MKEKEVPRTRRHRRHGGPAVAHETNKTHTQDGVRIGIRDKERALAEKGEAGSRLGMLASHLLPMCDGFLLGHVRIRLDHMHRTVG